MTEHALLPLLGPCDVTILGRHIEVAAQNGRFALFERAFEVATHALHPAQLVPELFRAHLAPVREVGAHHANAAHPRADHAGLRIIVTVAKALLDLRQWLMRENGDAIVGALAVHSRLVAKRLEGRAREVVVCGLQLLKADEFRLLPREPCQEPRLAGPHGVQVPGGDPHRPDSSSPTARASPGHGRLCYPRVHGAEGTRRTGLDPRPRGARGQYLPRAQSEGGQAARVWRPGRRPGAG